MRNDIIKLQTQYKFGKEIRTNEVEIYAEKKSLTRSEFYSSYNVGLSAKYIFEMSPDEFVLADVVVGDKIYHATHVKYEGHTMPIIRTFEKSISSMEITIG